METNLFLLMDYIDSGYSVDVILSYYSNKMRASSNAKEHLIINNNIQNYNIGGLKFRYNMDKKTIYDKNNRRLKLLKRKGYL